MESGFWKKLKKPIMAIAPMSGVTDQAFRLMFAKYGKPSVFWTEFVPVAGFFSKGREHCLKTLSFLPKERPIVAQVFGADPSQFKRSAEEIVKLGFDGIDINMGCPDKDVEKKGAGAALIKNPDLAKEIILATKKGAGKLPVSVKTRIGYSKNEINKWIPAILKAEPAALIVHLRTRDELYFVTAHWELAEKIIKLRDKYSPRTLILGNGDVKSAEEARKLVKKTGLDGVMIGRSILGNPWFFSKHIPTLNERLNAVIEHAEIFESFYKEEIKKKGYCKQFVSIRKHFHAYTKGFNGAKDLREKLMRVKNSAETKIVVKGFLKKSSL